MMKRKGKDPRLIGNNGVRISGDTVDITQMLSPELMRSLGRKRYDHTFPLF